MRSCQELRNLKPGHLMYFRVSRGGKVFDELGMVSDVERDSSGNVNAVMCGHITYAPTFLADMPSNRTIVEALSTVQDLRTFFAELKATVPQQVAHTRPKSKVRDSARAAKPTVVED